jgi:pentapeptide repeat protein
MNDDKRAESQEQEPQADGRGWRLVKFDILKTPPTALADLVYVIAALFVLAVLILVGFGLIASFHLGYESLVGSFERRIEAAKVFFPILLALVGGPLLIWRVITAHIQAQATRHQADTGREAHYTSLFTRAVEQLGATREVKETIETDDGAGDKKRETNTKTEANLEVRLGAIYAFDRIARDSERDHWPIMEVLCAYVRNPQNEGRQGPGGTYGEVRVDVQAALSVIGRRTSGRIKHEKARGLQLDFSKAPIAGAQLAGGDFSNSKFSYADMRDAAMRMAKLNGARFFGTNLQGADFPEADLSDARFNSSKLDSAWFGFAHLRGATFENADIGTASFLLSRLAGAVFFDADLSKARDLDAAALVDALGDATTTLPEGMERPKTWPDRELSWSERNDWIESARDGSAQT